MTEIDRPHRDEADEETAVAEGGASPSGGPAGAVALVDLLDTPLSVDAVLDAVASPRAGGVVTFVGVVRDHDTPARGQVTELDYSAHPTALRELTVVAEEIAARPGIVAVAAIHRTGALTVGDRAVVLAVSASHRGEAFEAARAFIDELKRRVPIWKHQVFADGSDEWVGTP